MGRQRLGDCPRNTAAQTVTHGLAHAFRLDDSLTPQDCQMLRHQRLLQVKVGCETANRLISLNQPTHDHETMRTCQHPQEVAGI